MINYEIGTVRRSGTICDLGCCRKGIFGNLIQKALVCIYFLLLASDFIRAQTDDGQRYVGLQMLNLSSEPDYAQDIIEQSVNYGCNLVVLTVYWDEVYKESTSVADWRQPDRQIELITRLGAKVGLRIMVGRKSDRLAGFWTSKETMNDDLGRPLSGAYGRTCFSFAHAPTVTKSQSFIKEVCQRYNSYQSQGKILYVTFVNTPTQELGYHYETELDGDYKKVYATGFDYSAPATDAFKIWIGQQYKRVNKLNYLWGTKFSTLNDVRPPGTAYKPLPAYQTRAGKDWYLFTHLQLKNYIDQSISIIKQVNSSYKIVNEFGAVTDAQSAVRGTIAFKSLDKNADGIKVHNDPFWSHRFIADVLRSNSAGKWIMNETFFFTGYSTDVLIRHFNDCFEGGCKVVTMVASIPDPNLRNVFEPVASRWRNSPLREIVPQITMNYKVSDVLDSTAARVEKEWEIKAPKFNPAYVNVQLNEDILSEDYWKPLLVNVYPVVSNPITDRAGKPRKSYSYTLPKDVFTDPDGDIVNIEVTEKPQWLSFSNGVFSGTIPDQLGDNKITLRATDDEGATVLTNFNFKVTNVNAKPIVKRTIPDFEAYLEQSIYYQFQGDIFDDPDGVIARVQAIGVRPWMTVNSKEFSAYPQEQGTFTVTLRGYDDDSAFVETAFKVKVINRPPIVKQLLPEKVIAQNKAFKFKIPQTFFSDPDGQITKLKAVRLPSWLTFDGTELRGTPTEVGIYRLGIRAFDNGGDSVETPFVITVDVRGNLNTPPTLRYQISDVQLFVTQKFSYKIPDSLFYDTNGYVDRIETPNLPAWLTFKNNEISGLATQAGSYTITLRAVDDDETFTSTTFKIEVRYAAITFELIQAGKAGTRRLIGPLRERDVLLESTIPDRITIYANCEAPAKKVTFKLSGPYQKTVTAERFPFSLFDEETGFVPIVGSYTLEATAFNDSVQVSTSTIHFKVQTTQPLSDWEVYPNPFGDVCNIKLPDTIDVNALTFKVVSLSGQALPLLKKQILIIDKVAYLNFTSSRISAGTYLLQVIQNEIVQKVVKIVKQ
ncbi:putative Ig domain-containing protein [Runella sp.]|uniref:putative Ig domain-containing protein n=1 Tax=Runella sp. TaxID=1960881 RepID=UPI00301AEE54